MKFYTTSQVNVFLAKWFCLWSFTQETRVQFPFTTYLINYDNELLNVISEVRFNAVIILAIYHLIFKNALT